MRTLAASSLLLPFLLAGCAMPAAQSSASGSPNPAANATREKAILLLQVQSRSNDPAVRANCIEALQPSSDPRAADIIDAGLHDPQWLVRFAACMAEGKRKNADVKPTLQQLATADPNGSVRAAAIYALRRLGDTTNMNALAPMLSSNDPSTRANTALVLGMMGDPSAIPLLQSHDRESDSRVKFEITAALARLGDTRAQQVIAALAISKYADDQWTAMAVCPDLPHDIAANALVLGLQPPPPNTPDNLKALTIRRQLIAARSLGKLHSAQGAKVATDNLQSPDPSLRALAALALGELLTPDQAPALNNLLTDPDPDVQRAAAAAVIETFARARS